MKYIVLKSTKHEELTFHHAFIFAFIPFFIGVILSKVCVCVCVCVCLCGVGIGKRDMKGGWQYRELSIEGRFNPPAHYGRTLEVI